MSNCKLCLADCAFSGKDMKKGTCKGYIPMTNSDRVRAMSDEELAKAINLLVDGESAIQYCRSLPECDEDLERDTVIPLDRCEKCVLHWLQQPVKEDTTC